MKAWKVKHRYIYYIYIHIPSNIKSHLGKNPCETKKEMHNTAIKFHITKNKILSKKAYWDNKVKK